MQDTPSEKKLQHVRIRARPAPGELPHDIAARHAMAPEKFLKFPSDNSPWLVLHADPAAIREARLSAP
jgi:hypothetical protein